MTRTLGHDFNMWPEDAGDTYAESRRAGIARARMNSSIAQQGALSLREPAINYSKKTSWDICPLSKDCINLTYPDTFFGLCAENYEECQIFSMRMGQFLGGVAFTNPLSAILGGEE